MIVSLCHALLKTVISQLSIFSPRCPVRAPCVSHCATTCGWGDRGATYWWVSCGCQKVKHKIRQRKLNLSYFGSSPAMILIFIVIFFFYFSADLITAGSILATGICLERFLCFLIPSFPLSYSISLSGPVLPRLSPVSSPGRLWRRTTRWWTVMKQ